MGFRPLHDWVLIKRSTPEEKTTGGIIIPDAVKSKSTEGIVAAIGPGKFVQEKGRGRKEKKFISTVLRPGQRVMFVEYMAKEVVLDGEEITLIQEDNILGVLENFGELEVRKQYHVEIKKDRPPMVQAPKSSPEVTKPVETGIASEKPEKKGRAKVKTAAAKLPAKGKDNKSKKTVKTAAPKKAAPKKAAPARQVAAKKVIRKTAAKKI